MCIICLEFQKYRDIADARQMVMSARREPKSIERAHLDELDVVLDAAEKAEKEARDAKEAEGPRCKSQP